MIGQCEVQEVGCLIRTVAQCIICYPATPLSLSHIVCASSRSYSNKLYIVSLSVAIADGSDAANHLGGQLPLTGCGPAANMALVLMTRILLPLLSEINEIARSVAFISIIGSPGTGNGAVKVPVSHYIAPEEMHPVILCCLCVSACVSDKFSLCMFCVSLILSLSCVCVSVSVYVSVTGCGCGCGCVCG